MNKVTLKLTGVPGRTVYFKERETLGQLGIRLGSKSWPVHRVDGSGWYFDGKSIKAPGLRAMQDGDTYFATPRVNGSRVQPRALLNVPGQPEFILGFQEGDTFRDALAFAPRRIQEAAALARSWTHWDNGVKRMSWPTSNFKLSHNMRIDALTVNVLLRGFGGSMYFRILDDEHLGDFMSRAAVGLNGFPMFFAKRYFVREPGGSTGREIHNPGHFVLKPGMNLVLEGAKEAHEEFLHEEQMKKEGWRSPRDFILKVNGESYQCSFTPGETLADFLKRCPITADDARKVRTWTMTKNGAQWVSSRPSVVKLRRGEVISGVDNR